MRKQVGCSKELSGKVVMHIHLTQLCLK